MIQVGYEEDKNIDPKAWESLHIAKVFQSADEFDIIHNNFDFFSLTYSGLVDMPVLTTIHGFSSEKILPVYEKYSENTYYVSISDSDRSSSLNYIDTVYHRIDLTQFTYRDLPEDPWEVTGYVPNVVFTCGAMDEGNGTLKIWVESTVSWV